MAHRCGSLDNMGPGDGMVAERNFSVKWTLAEANTVRKALEELMRDNVLHIDAGHATVAEREEADRIATILQRDF